MLGSLCCCRCWRTPSCASSRTASATRNASQRLEPTTIQSFKASSWSLYWVTSKNREENDIGIRFRVTIDLRHFQSSTRGRPGSLTLVRTDGPFSGPKRSAPIILMLPSRWILCLKVLDICPRISFLFSELSSVFLYCRALCQVKAWRKETATGSFNLAQYHSKVKSDASLYIWKFSLLLVH